MWNPRQLLPFAVIKCRKKYVAFNVSMNLGEVETVREKKRLTEYVRDTNNENLFFLAPHGYGESVFQRMHDVTPGCLVVLISGHNNIRAVRQGPEFLRDRLVVLSSHDNMMPACRLHEVLHVVRE